MLPGPRPIDEWREAKLAVISVDSDWVEEETFAAAHAQLLSLGLPVTYFLTQSYAPLAERSPVPIELGPHPNFTGVADLEPELRRCLAFAPGAVSYRAHSCVWSERLRPVLRGCGIRYSSSAMQYLQPGIVPYEIAHGIVEIPLFWMDMFHLEYCDFAARSPFDVEDMQLEEPGLKVFDIHPVHVVLNTESRDHYGAAKAHYHEPQNLAARRSDGPGIWDLFREVIERLGRLDYEFCLLRDVWETYGAMTAEGTMPPAVGAERR